MEHAGGQRAGDGTGQRGRDPDAGVLDDVAHLQHTGAKALTDQTAHTVFLVAHHGKTDHLGAAACHGGTASKAGQTQRGADGGRGNGQGQRHAHNDGYKNAHGQRGLLGGPHDQGAHLTCGGANGCGDQHGKAHAGKNGHQRGHENVHAGLLAHGIGRVAYGDQAEQHQRRAVQRPADGTGHGRAAHGRGVAAKVYQHVKAGLLAQRLDDGADQQAGKQALRHGTQRFNEIALRGDDDILAF